MDKRVSQRCSHSWFRTYTYNCVLWGTQFDPLSLRRTYLLFLRRTGIHMSWFVPISPRYHKIVAIAPSPRSSDSKASQKSLIVRA